MPGGLAAGQSSAEVLGVPGTVLAEKLTGHLVREIMLRGSGGGPLTPLADQLNHDLTHLQGQRVEDMLARLVTLGITAPTPSAGAGGPARDVGPAPTGAVRVSEADPRRLGVHAAISVPGVPDEVPPEYVPRDVDATEHGVRARVAAAAQRGGFVLLVGGSSVGKTRCAVEAVKALLPDWWLVHPAGPAEVAALAAGASRRGLVVWLDELQRYLDGEHGLTGAVVRALLNAPGPVVIIGTLWPDWYAAYASVPAARRRRSARAGTRSAGPGRRRPHRPGVQPGGAGYGPAPPRPVIRRLRVALESAGYGLTQTLAAAPQLVARWEDAQTASPYAWAVLTAALDAARLGARAPLSTDFLRAAAPGYCTSQQQAEAPDNWFEQALAYATGKLHGAVAALSPAGAGMGRVAGYTVADYLIQHASRERRAARVPASTWDAILSHIRDPADTARLADSAKGRLLYCYAIPLYRHAADADHVFAAFELAGLLARRGDLDELRAQADAGDWFAARRLDVLLARRGDLEELRARADAGDWFAASELAGLLAEQGDLDELRARADAGDGGAAMVLAGLLAGRGDLDELRARADAGDGAAALRLDELLDQAAQIPRARADAGDRYAAMRLAGLLAERGDLDELRARADAGDGYAAMRLAGLLAGRGDLDELRARADAGDRYAAMVLAGLLAGRGDLDELRARADAGDGYAAMRLAGQGDLDELRARAVAGDKEAASLLAGLLIKQGRGEEAERLRRFGLRSDGSIASA